MMMIMIKSLFKLTPTKAKQQRQKICKCIPEIISKAY